MYNLFMSKDPRLVAFIEKALAAGIPHESLVGILTARGWQEKEVYEVLADHYRSVTGIDVPHRSGAGASAREAFFYLLIFLTLAIWTIAFGHLAFALINEWIPDPLFSGYGGAQDTYTIPLSLAALIIAFPLYLFISSVVLRETEAHSEKLESPIRKWLTYMALVIAAAVFVGDLITILAYLLRGELTSRFMAKSVIVLLLSGGVFSYYFSGIRRTEAAPAQPRHDKLIAGLSLAIVALLLVLGFLHLGSPSRQRELRADSQRIYQLYQLSLALNHYWTTHAAQLPATLNQLSNHAYTDPMTRASYEYHPGQGSQYELCAVFAQSRETASSPDNWTHPAGRYCFPIDASSMLPFPPPYAGD